MATIHQTLEAVRAYIGRPPTDKINKDDLFMMLLGRLNYYRQKLGLTDQNWLIAESFLNVDENNNEYVLNVADFSRPIKVEFYDPLVPYRNGPEIEIINLQNSDRYNIGSGDSFSYNSIDEHGSDTSYVANAIAFYGLPPLSMKVRIIPRPRQAVQYRIYYEPITSQSASFAEEPGLMTQFHDMLAVATALLALPRCGHSPEVFAQYQGILTMELTRLESVFDHFRLSRKHNDTRLRRPFRPGGSGWTR